MVQAGTGGFTDGDNGNSDGIYMNQMDDAFAQIVAQTGIGKFDIIAFDACLMAQIEVFSAIAPYAEYGVASEETIPAIGFAYAGFLQQLVDNPSMSAADLARTMVDSYISQDLRIANDDARREFVEEVYNYQGEVSAEEVTTDMSVDVTLSAIDLSKIAELHTAFNNFTIAMTTVDQSAVAQARSYAQSYYSIFGPDTPASYLDIINFASLVVSESGNDSGVSQAMDSLNSAIQSAVIAEMHGPDRPGSKGISIYFPNSELYASSYGGYDIYNATASRFVNESQWDDFLAFHYSGQTYDEGNVGPAVPNPESTQAAPGQGDIGVYPVSASPDTIPVGGTVNLQTEVYGDNIGYIYFFSGQYFEDTNELVAMDADFILADQTLEMDGVYYPDWGSTSVQINIDWSPIYYNVTDGVNTEFAVLYPYTYGATQDERTYIADGNYTFGDGSTHYAVMLFGNDGYLRSVYSYDREGGPSSAREISPAYGDNVPVFA